jgi:hypothetical protein
MTASDEDMRGWRLALDYTPFPDLARGHWLSPRPGIHRLVPPWVYRHPRFYGAGHIAGGSVQAAAGLICLAYGAHDWAAFFLVIAALNVAGGYWYLTIDRSASALT